MFLWDVPFGRFSAPARGSNDDVDAEPTSIELENCQLISIRDIVSEVCFFPVFVFEAFPPP